MDKYQIYHPANIGKPEDWYVCHHILGIVPYKGLGSPASVTADLLPEWYTKLDDEDYAATDHAQDEYLRMLLRWITDQGVKKAYFDGGYESREAKVLEDNGVPSRGFFQWRPELIDVLTRVNLKNLWLETNDTVLIVYDGWDTVFINNLEGVPKELFDRYTPHFKI